MLPVGRRILDPRNVIPDGHWVPPGPLPHAVRRFGAVPHFDAIQPGDLLLIREIRPGIVAKGIEAFQAISGHDSDAAKWTHATVYTGNGYIVEVTITGVRWSSIYKYCTGNHLMLFRRSPDLSLEQGYQVAIRSLHHLRRKYDVGAAALIGFHTAAFGLWRNSLWRPALSTSICSMLYAEAFSWVTGKTMENRESGEITPAYLSQTQSLIDVPVGWREIVPAGFCCSFGW